MDSARRVVGGAFAVALVACGPAVPSDSGAGSSGTTAGAGTTGQDTRPSTGRPDDDVPPPPPPPPPGTTTGLSTTGLSTVTTDSPETTGDSSSTSGPIDEDTCTCEALAEPMDYRAKTDDGLFPADLLESATPQSHTVVWHALEGTPSSVFDISLSYEGGQTFDNPGGCCGLFLCAPCPEGATLPVLVSLSSGEDGLLDEVLEGTLVGSPYSEYMPINIDATVPFAALEGTLPAQALDGVAPPHDFDTLRLSVSWYPDEEEWVPNVSLYTFNESTALTLADNDG